MNKKVYITPLIEVTKIEMENLLAASTPMGFSGLGDDELENGGETPSDFSKHHDVWGFED